MSKSPTANHAPSSGGPFSPSSPGRPQLCSFQIRVAHGRYIADKNTSVSIRVGAHEEVSLRQYEPAGNPVWGFGASFTDVGEQDPRARITLWNHIFIGEDEARIEIGSVTLKLSKYRRQRDEGSFHMLTRNGMKVREELYVEAGRVAPDGSDATRPRNLLDLLKVRQCCG